MGERPRPTPRPRPLRADSETVGRKTSRMLNVAAADNARMTTSSTLSVFLGMTILTTAMTRPITKYLTMRLTSSEKSKPIGFLYITKTKKYTEIQTI
jgi:hypothetical protein